MATIVYDKLSEITEDIVLGLENLYATTAGTQPMDREYGLNYDEIIDQSPEIAKNQLALEIIEKTEKYEPRVTVEEVSCEIDATGGVVDLRVSITANEDYVADTEDDDTEDDESEDEEDEE